MSAVGGEFFEQVLGWVVGNALGTASVVVSVLLAILVKSRAFRIGMALVVVLLLLGVGGSVHMTHDSKHDPSVEVSAERTAA